MKDEKEQLEALQDIRKMMKDSSKFLSLNGLSGVFAGVYALIGAYMGHRLIVKFFALGSASSDYDYNRISSSGLLVDLVLICLGVLFLSIATALYLSNNKAKKTNQKL